MRATGDLCAFTRNARLSWRRKLLQEMPNAMRNARSSVAGQVSPVCSATFSNWRGERLTARSVVAVTRGSSPGSRRSSAPTPTSGRLKAHRDLGAPWRELIKCGMDSAAGHALSVDHMTVGGDLDCGVGRGHVLQCFPMNGGAVFVQNRTAVRDRSWIGDGGRNRVLMNLRDDEQRIRACRWPQRPASGIPRTQKRTEGFCTYGWTDPRPRSTKAPCCSTGPRTRSVMVDAAERVAHVVGRSPEI